MRLKKNLFLGVSVIALGFTFTTSKAMAQATITQDAAGVFSATFDSATTVDPTDNATLGGTSDLANGLVVNAASDGTSAGTVTIADGVDIGDTAGASVTASQNDLHELIIEGTTTVSGTVGAGNALAEIEAGATGKTVEFEGTVAATDIVIKGTYDEDASTGYVSFADAVNGDIEFESDGMAAFANGNGGNVNIVGNVTTTDGNGTIYVESDTPATDSVTFTGTIGASDAALKEITLGGATAGGVAIFAGEVHADSIELVHADSDATFAADVYGNLEIDADAEASFSDGVTLTGNVTVENDGEGALNFAQSGEVTGTVGSQNVSLGLVETDAGAAGTVTFGNTAYVDGLKLGNIGDTIDFNASSHIGDLNVAGGAAGTVVLSHDAVVEDISQALATISVDGADKTVTFEGANIRAADLNVTNDATFKISADATTTGNVTLNDSTLALGEKSLTTGGTLAITDDAEITFTVTDDDTGGKIDATGQTVNFGAGGYTLTITPTFDGYDAEDGDTYTLITAGTLTEGDVTYDVANTTLVTWAADGSVGNNLVLTATVKEASEISGVNTRTAKAVDNAPAALKAKVQAATTSADVNKAATQLSPEANNGSSAASMSVNNQVANVIGSRASAVRSGVATGDALKDVGVWGQTFGFTGSQDKTDGIDGYDATTYGMAFGADAEVGKDLIAGLALSYANTSIDGKGDTKNNGNDINSYGLTLYGTKDMGKFYIDSSLGYAYHDYDAVRAVNVLGINQRLKAGYNGHQYSVGLGAGMPYDLENAVVTPWVKMNYSHLNQDGYTETGGTAALKVDSRETDSFRTGLGFNLNSEFKAVEASFAPELRVGWFHEFGDEKTDSTSRYASGGASFKTEGAKIDRDSAVVGLGLTMTNTSNWAFSLNYDAEIKSDYDSHTGTLQARYNF